MSNAIDQLNALAKAKAEAKTTGGKSDAKKRETFALPMNDIRRAKLDKAAEQLNGMSKSAILGIIVDAGLDELLKSYETKPEKGKAAAQ
jgi:hypothetical protein